MLRLSVAAYTSAGLASVKPPTLWHNAATELVNVKPGSPETAGTRYLGLAEALDRLRAVMLTGKLMPWRRILSTEREAGLDSARRRALETAADHGFGWRPREFRSRQVSDAPRIERNVNNPVRASGSVRKPYIRPKLTFTDALPAAVGAAPTTAGSGVKTSNR
jgi:hypothetical protein